MDFFEFPEDIKRYEVAHSGEDDPLLDTLYRSTHLKTVHPQMLSGKVQGQFLKILSGMIRPSRILEIGTFTGYSAYCLSKGLSEEGKLTTIEVNEELEDIIAEFFAQANCSGKIELIIGDAREIIPTLENKFDLIFLDANKEHYPDYYELCIEKLNPGGYLLADNVLWGGKVLDSESKDFSTKQIQRFNKTVQEDKRMENVFLTVRDGLMLAKKI